jgi:hypothetical protein
MTTDLITAPIPSRQLAETLAKSTLVPKQYIGKPDDILVAIQTGRELDMPPAASLRTFAVIGGTPKAFGDGFLAVIQTSPAYQRHVEYFVDRQGERVDALGITDLSTDASKAVAMFWRKGNPEPFTKSFSIHDAKRAKLWGKPGPWTEYPGRMLQMRAREFAGRDAFSDRLMGLTISDYDDPHDEPLDVSVDAAYPERPPMPVRRSEKSAPEPEPVASDPAAPTSPEGHASPDVLPNAAGSERIAYLAVVHVEEIPAKASNGGKRQYQIEMVVHHPDLAPVGYTFVTRDESVQRIAADAIGLDQTFTATWVPGIRGDGGPCKNLKSLVATE